MKHFESYVIPESNHVLELKLRFWGQRESEIDENQTKRLRSKNKEKRQQTVSESKERHVGNRSDTYLVFMFHKVLQKPGQFVSFDSTVTILII